MRAWFQYRDRAWVTGISPPLLVRRESLAVARRVLHDAGVEMIELDLSGAESTWDVTMRLKSLLPFPDWCGASWDSFDDAFEELRQELALPAALVVDGLDDLLERSRQVALETVVRLAELGTAFSVAGDQFAVLYLDG